MTAIRDPILGPDLGGKPAGEPNPHKRKEKQLGPAGRARKNVGRIAKGKKKTAAPGSLKSKNLKRGRSSKPAKGSPKAARRQANRGTR